MDAGAAEPKKTAPDLVNPAGGTPTFGPLFLAPGQPPDDPDDGTAGALVPAGTLMAHDPN